MADLLPPEFADRARLYRMVAGPIRDALGQHPDYLTPRGARLAERSIAKRVVGTLLRHVIQTREGGLRSGGGSTASGGSSSPEAWPGRVQPDGCGAVAVRCPAAEGGS